MLGVFFLFFEVLFLSVVVVFFEILIDTNALLLVSVSANLDTKKCVELSIFKCFYALEWPSIDCCG